MAPPRAPAVALLLAALLAGCGGGGTPEEQVRAVLAAGEQAAESRSARAVLAFAAADFRARDMDAATVERYLRAWFLAHPSVELLTRVERLEFPAEDLAEVELTVGMLGRGAAESFEFAAELYAVDLTLAREGDDWRVTRADLRRGVR